MKKIIFLTAILTILSANTRDEVYLQLGKPTEDFSGQKWTYTSDTHKINIFFNGNSIVRGFIIG